VDPGANPILGTLLAVALGGSFLAVLFLHGETVWKTLSSIRLAVVTLSSIGILSVIGTMVVQRFGAGSLPEPEQKFVEKFLQGQGAVPVNARFMLSPPEVRLTKPQEEHADLVGQAFGAGKGRQLRKTFEQMAERQVKTTAIDEHVRERRPHLLRLFERLDGLGFTNVFRTWWFNSLLVLLFVQVVSVIAKRYPWGWMQSGWVMTHCGVLVVLVGCVISDGLLKDGSLGLSPGQTEEKFQEYTRLDARGRPTDSELGFRVRMLGTDQTFYHEIQMAFPGVRAGHDILWTQEQLREGRAFAVKDPETGASYDVKVAEVWERARVETTLVSAAAVGRPGGEPAIRVSLLHAEAGEEPHAVSEGWLFGREDPREGLPPWMLQYRRADSGAEARALVTGSAFEGAGRHGTLSVRIPGTAEALRVPATEGAGAEAVASGDGILWSVTVKKFHPTYMVNRPPMPEDPDAEPENPALEVLVRKVAGDGAAVEAPMIVYGHPRLQDQWEDMVRQGHLPPGAAGAAKPGTGPAAECSYSFDFLPARRTWIVDGPGVPRTLVVRTRGKGVEARPIEPGSAFPLLGDYQVRLEEALEDAVEDLRIQPLHQETDEEYLQSCLRALEAHSPPAPTTAVAKLEIKERDAAGERARTEWLVADRAGVAQGRSYRSTDGRFLIAMAETRNALMFRSALEVRNLDDKPILRDGEPVRTVVRVNHPLQWGGYAFYQNSFIEGTSTQAPASVFRVKYDRGIPTIYSGFAILTLGVCMMLYLNPLLRKRRRAEGVAADAAGRN
jgi:hypothetical protein